MDVADRSLEIVESRTINIVLWGATQSGKSTALAAYLWNGEVEWLDRRSKETEQTLVRLGSDIWDALKENRLPSGTVEARSYAVRHRQGHMIRFRDMRGEFTRNLELHAEDLESLRTAQAAILFVEWPSHLAVENMGAVERALKLISNDLPIAVVVTKVECALTMTDFSLLAMDKGNHLSRMELDTDTLNYLTRLYMLRHPVFPISVYGYDRDGNPAHYRDEFGRLVPRNIDPFNVNAPFDHVLQQLF